jgi:Protein of unknown function (DUF3592)
MANPVNPYIYLICLWPFGFVLTWAIWNSFRDSRDEKLILRSLGWPEMNGEVTSSKAIWAHVEVCYQYSVRGTSYTGKYKMNLTPVVPDRTGRGAAQTGSEVWRDLREFQCGQKVVIRYNPARPEESVFYCSGETYSEGKEQDAPEFRVLG